MSACRPGLNCQALPFCDDHVASRLAAEPRQMFVLFFGAHALNGGLPNLGPIIRVMIVLGSICAYIDDPLRGLGFRL